VTPVNDPPVAVNDFYTTPEDTPVSGNVNTNDSDVDGPVAVYTLVPGSGPANGTLTLNPNGSFTYTPAPNFNGTDNFTYSLCDGGTANLCDTAVVTINVTPVNDPPVANADVETTPEDTPVTINVLGNDTDVDGTIVPNSVALVTQPVNGTVFINPLTGQITYTPNPNFNGTDIFIYLACDNGTPLPSLCDTAVVTVTVTPVNDPMLAVDDFASTNQSTPVDVNVIGNDVDTDGNINPGSLVIITQPTQGTVAINNSTGVITYTPFSTACGSDSFVYQICDDGTPLPPTCDQATVFISISDTQAPQLTDCPSDITVPTAAGICGAPVSWTAPSVSDNCDSSPLVSSSHVPGSVFPVGVTTVTYTAIDDAGNSSVCTFTVTVTDTEAPVITNCPTTITVNHMINTCWRQVYWPTITATDNCGSGNVTVTTSYPPGYVFPVGNTVVDVTAVDLAGNTSTCSFNVIVVDAQAPVISVCPSNRFANSVPGVCGAPVYWDNPTVFDNCPGVTFVSSHASGSIFPVGVTQVSLIAVDGAGLSDTCVFNVTVFDVEAPVIVNGPANVTQNNDAGNCSAVVNWSAPSATDNCAVVSFTSNFAPGAVFPVGTTTVSYTAVDSVGNTTVHNFTVTVVDAEQPVVANCPSDISIPAENGICGATATWTAPTFTDNCGAVVVDASHASGDLFPVGTTEVIYTATDATGNITICTFEVTVTDTQAPLIANCPANINSCSTQVSWTEPAVSDNCGAVTVTASHQPGSEFPVGTTTVTYTATDSAGNVSVCSFQVTVSVPELIPVSQNVTCFGNADGVATVIVNNAVGPFTFDWGTLGTDSLITGLAPGSYPVQVTDGIGCSADTVITITEPLPFLVQAISVTGATCGFEDGQVSVETTGGTLPYTYLWSNGQSTENLSNVSDGSYVLFANDANGCADTLNVTIECEFGKVPQLVTPNGDGHNDVWNIPGIDKFPEAAVELYNRWGTLIFKASPYLNNWDGYSAAVTTVGNGRLPAGTYFYVIQLTKNSKAITGYIELQY
jgi:gliding motility-associated-like protein